MSPYGSIIDISESKELFSSKKKKIQKKEKNVSFPSFLVSLILLFLFLCRIVFIQMVWLVFLSFKFCGVVEAVILHNKDWAKLGH
jgi:hypothetical protein